MGTDEDYLEDDMDYPDDMFDDAWELFESDPCFHCEDDADCSTCMNYIGDDFR